MKAYRKDYRRAIQKSFGRFLSILLIVAIGTAFYSGFRMAGTDMRLSADQYYKDTHLMDLMVQCNFGIDNEDLSLLKKAPGVSQVTPGKTADAFDEEYGTNLKVMALYDPENGVNEPSLLSGNWPQAEDECVVDAAQLGGTFPLGSTITLTLKDSANIEDVFHILTYKVVGTVTSPLYIGSARGNSTVGSGLSDGFILVSPKAFATEAYTEAYVTLNLNPGATAFTPAYDKEVRDASQELFHALEPNRAARYDRLKAEPQAVLDQYQPQLDQLESNLARLNTQLEAAKGAVEQAENMAVVDESSLKEIEAEYEKAYATIAADEEAFKQASAAIPLLQKEIASLTKERDAAYNSLLSDRQYLNAVTSMNQALGKDPSGDPEVRAFSEKVNQGQNRYDALNASVLEKQAAIQANEDTIARVSPNLNANQTIVSQYAAKLEAARHSAEGKASAVAQSQQLRDSIKAEIDRISTDSKEWKTAVDEANKELQRLGSVNYYVSERNVNPSYQEYGLNATRIDVISYVFPFFFILVAILICLNTMTRMVEEETTLIGTYKALGYGNGKIIGKYLNYCLIATLLGGAAGIAVGFKLLPYAIMRSYGVLYNFSNPVTAVQWGTIAVVALVSFACTMIPAGVAAWQELRSVPAQLMRPKTPKMGKRILLERIGFLWNHLSFNLKVTFRNMFRYKKRMLMTIVGITGGTALLLAGLGFRNSLQDVVRTQFEQLFHYDLIVHLDEDADERQRMELDSVLALSSSGSLYTYSKNMDIVKDDRVVPMVNMVVGEQANQEVFTTFVTLRDRKTGKKISLNQDSVILTEKAAELLDVKVGDTVTLRDGGGNEYNVTLTAITENYAGHYLYMGETVYSKFFGRISTYTTVMVKAKGISDFDRRLVAEAANRMEFVQNCVMTSTLKRSYTNTVSGLQVIVIVFILCAVALVFIVLYNLTIINISERTRELATFKVLGFTNSEVSGFVSRENVIYTVVGIVAGLFAGFFLCRFVVTTAEMTDVMFGRSIDLSSYWISAGVTLAFTVLVNIVMSFKIRRINMVEALKSIE